MHVSSNTLTHIIAHFAVTFADTHSPAKQFTEVKLGAHKGARKILRSVSALAADSASAKVRS